MRAAFFILLATASFAGMEIRGGVNLTTVIPNNDTTPNSTDGTAFGNVMIPGSKEVTFQVKNTGGASETILGISEDGPAWSISSGGSFGVIGSSGTRNFVVRLEPTSGGYKNATVFINTTAGVYTFVVDGTGIGEPEIVVRGRLNSLGAYTNIVDGDTTPTTADGTVFETVSVGNTITHTFEIENTGTDQIIIDSITEDSNHFSVAGVPATVGVGQKQTFNVKFTPTNIGTYTATVTIQNNDANEDPFTLEITGTATAPNITVFGGTSQNQLIITGDTTPSTTDGTDFGTIVAGGPDVTKTFKITNLGTENLIVSVITDDAAAFSVTSAPTALTPIAPNASTTFNVVLSTTTAGSKYGTISIVSNDPDTGVFEFDVKAEATGNPEIDVKGRLNTLVNYVSIPDGTTGTSTGNGTDFEDQSVSAGGLTHTFQIANTGNAKLNIDSITDNSSEFSVTAVPTGVTVDAATATFNVTFNPTSVGVKNATVTIENDDPNEDPYTFAVTGRGTGGVTEVNGGVNFAVVIPVGDITPSTTDGTDFGSVDAGIGSVSKIFRVFNRGNTNMLWNGVTEDGAAFSVTSQPAVGSNISAGNSVNFTILFAPTSAGTKLATVAVGTTDPVNPVYTFDITGVANGTALMTVQGPVSGPPGLFAPVTNGATVTSTGNGTDFGSVSASSGSVTHTFQITNTGSSQLSITGITETSEHFSVSNVPTVVGVNQTQTFDVIFNPTSIGSKSTTITINTNAGGDASYTFKVVGLGVDPNIQVREAAAATGYEGPVIEAGDPTPSVEEGTSWALDLTTSVYSVGHFQIQNTGNQNLIINAVSLTGNAWELHNAPAAFSVVAPGSFFEFEIWFKPTAAGLKAGTLSVLTNDPDTPIYQFALAGEAYGSAGIEIAGRSIPVANYVTVTDGATTATAVNGTDFGTVNSSSSGLSHTFRIENTGTAQLDISSIIENSTNFTITNVPAVVGVNQTQEFVITFKPTAPGEKTATVTITSNAEGDSTSYTFLVRGFGEAPDIKVTGGVNFAEEIPYGKPPSTPTNGTDFGYVSVSGTSVTHTFRIENIGSEPLVVYNTTSTNPNFTFAGVPSAVNPIAAGGSNEFTVTYDPSSPAAELGFVSLITNDPDEPVWTLRLYGVGTNDVPEIAVIGQNSSNIANGNTNPTTPNGRDFGNVDIATGSVTRTFTIENQGTGYLTVSSITENSTHYSISGGPTQPIAPGDSATFDITFNPSAAGNANATVTILSDDADEATFTFGITGTGVNTPPPAVPDIQLLSGELLDKLINNLDASPRHLDGTDFGQVMVGVSKTLTYRITNTGTATLNIQGLQIPNTPEAAFSLPSPMSIPAGTSSDFSISFTPQDVGVETFELRIGSNDPDEALYVVALTAEGIPNPYELKITNIAAAGNNLELTFTSDPNKSYRIAVSQDLQSWLRPPGLRGLQGDPTAQTYVLPNAINTFGAKGFLRVEEEVP